LTKSEDEKEEEDEDDFVETPLDCANGF